MSEQTNTTDTIAVVTATPVDTVRVVVVTSRHARSRNEDAIGVGGWVLHGDHPDPLEITVPIGPNRPVAIAVADGMGGHPDGDRAARIAVEQLTRPAPPGESTEITDAFRRADTAIRIAAADRSRGMGCTAATLSLGIDGCSTIANVGDVRVYRIPRCTSITSSGDLAIGWCCAPTDCTMPLRCLRPGCPARGTPPNWWPT